MKPAPKGLYKDLWTQFVDLALDSLKKRGLYRSLTSLSPITATRVEIDGAEYVLFCSNDYLGLSNNERMKRSAMDAIRKWGTGSGASRFISGNISLYEQLESKVADFKGTDGAIVFSSGYATNVGVISSLAGKGDVILSDQLNHASIIDACRLSKAQVLVFPHKDMDRLEALLLQHYGKKILVVTDGVFSMDGDLAPVPSILELCLRFDALFLIDDAHGTGVLGKRGAGVLDYFGVESPQIVQVGTFSKALGSLGGFLACEMKTIEYVTNHARSLIYSTALPPSVLAANLEAIQILMEEGQGLKDRLAELAAYFRTGLENMGFEILHQPTPIFPIIIGDARETVALSRFLWAHGIFVPPIRPPTVPEGKSRLRISLSAAHERTDIDRLLHALGAFFRQGA